MEKIQKFVDEPEIKEVDEKKRIITHKISVEKKDRLGDIVRISGLDTKNYKKNPIVLYGHNYMGVDPLPVIGKNVGFVIEGKKLYAKTQFLNPDDVSPKLSDLVNDLWHLNKNKLLGWSIGFIPKKREDITDDDKVTGVDFKEAELLEYSNVIIPANQEAINNAIQKGEISRRFIEGILDDEELPGELAVKDIEEKCLECQNHELKSSQLQGVMPDLIKALQGIIEVLKNSQKSIADYLRKFTGGKHDE